MSLITNLSMNGDMKITPGESLLRMDADVSDGSRVISLEWMEFLINLEYGTPRFLRGMGSKLWQH